jgi:ABC-type nitrate/sulfonate/bicarbonate transport system permease component
MISIGLLGYVSDWAIRLLDQRLTSWARA